MRNCCLSVLLLLTAFALIQAQSGNGNNGNGNGNCDGPLNFLSCVGQPIDQPCHCYEKSRAPANTPQKKIMEYYRDNLVSRNYSAFASFLALDATAHVPQFGIAVHGNAQVTGREAVIVYHQLGDPAVSDRYEILSAEFIEMQQEYNKVFARLTGTYHVLNPAPGRPSVSQTENDWLFTFDPATGEVTDMAFIVDTYWVVTNLQSAFNNTSEFICDGLQTVCVGANTQFSSHADCMAFMQTVPAVLNQAPSLLSGFTRRCRSFHLGLAHTLPQLHCMHVGPLNIGPGSTPCNNY